MIDEGNTVVFNSRRSYIKKDLSGGGKFSGGYGIRFAFCNLIRRQQLSDSNSVTDCATQ